MKKSTIKAVALLLALSVSITIPVVPQDIGGVVIIVQAAAQRPLGINLIKPKKGKVTTSSIQVKFSPSKKKEVKRYCLYIRQKGTSKWKRVNVSKSRKNYTFKGLKQNTNYQIRMRAQGKTGYKYSKYTKTITVRTLKKAYAPTINKVSKSGATLTVKWSKAKNASKYVIYRATSKNGKYQKIATVNNKTTSYKNRNLTGNKTYWYKVRSYTSDNTYKTSKPVSGRTADVGPYAELAKWYAGYKVYGVPVYRVSSVQEFIELRNEYRKVIESKRTKYESIPLKNWKEREAEFPKVIVNHLYALDRINKYRKQERDGLTPEEYSIKEDINIDDIPWDVTFNETYEKYAAMRAFETSRTSKYEYRWSEWWTGNPHQRPLGLDSYGSENWSSSAADANGIIENWMDSPGHKRAILEGATGNGAKGYVMSCYYALAPSEVTDIDCWEASTVMELLSVEECTRWVKDGQK